MEYTSVLFITFSAPKNVRVHSYHDDGPTEASAYVCHACRPRGVLRGTDTKQKECHIVGFTRLCCLANLGSMPASTPVNSYITGRRCSVVDISSTITPMPFSLVNVSCTSKKHRFSRTSIMFRIALPGKHGGEVFSGDCCLSLRVDRAHGSLQMQDGHICQQETKQYNTSRNNLICGWNCLTWVSGN